MHPNTTLLSMIAHARSGALDYAQRLFREAGFDRISDDPAVLSVRGRLLKDCALATSGAKQRRLYLEAADAYARAGEIGKASYPLINAATLAFLAGRREKARQLARDILQRLRGGEDENETPYWRAATEAEALLLLGEVEPAKAVFKGAIARAPQAYEDHASTLRQFALILDELGEEKAWLNACRPPRSLHFAGQIAISLRHRGLEQQIRQVLNQERIGFAYGAVAAGTDILISEALLEAKAELHLLLPASVAEFRRESVVRFGDDWAKRFDAIVANVASIRNITKQSHPLSPLAIELAAEVAMGSAVMQAEALQTEAIQLLILERGAPPSQTGGASGSIGRTWLDSGRRQHVISAPRLQGYDDVYKGEKPDEASDCLVAMLRIDLSGIDAGRLSKHILPKLAQTLASKAKTVMPPRWTGDSVLAVFETPMAAARVGLSVVSAIGIDARIAADYAIGRRGIDPFNGTPFLTGSVVDLPAQIVLSTPAGAIQVTENFAAALYAKARADRPRVEFVGELPAQISDYPIRLFSLKP